MIKSKLVVVVVVDLMLFVAVMITSRCECTRAPEDYLMYGSNDHSQELNWISKRIKSGEWGVDVESIADNLALAASQAESNSQSQQDPLKISSYQGRMFPLKMRLADLSTLSRDAPAIFAAKCHNLEAKTFVGLLELNFGGLKNLDQCLKNPPKQPLFRYLQHYGPAHALECLASMAERFQEGLDQLPPKTEITLDSIVASTGDEATGEDKDSNLIRLAERLDLVGGKFNAKRMLSAVEHYAVTREADRKCLADPEMSGDLLASLLVTTCDTLRHSIPFDMYNLAKLLAPSEQATELEKSIKFRKLNEYSRICLAFATHQSKDKAWSNIVDNMKESF